jgi:hypothetical protein
MRYRRVRQSAAPTPGICFGRSKDNDVLEKEKEEVEPKEIHPIIKRQLNSLKNSMDSHGLTADDVINYIKKDNE